MEGEGEEHCPYGFSSALVLRQIINASDSVPRPQQNSGGMPSPHPKFGDEDGSCPCGCSFCKECVGVMKPNALIVIL